MRRHNPESKLLTESTLLHVWPPSLPSHFDGFYDLLEDLIDGCTVTRLDQITSVAAADASPDAVVVVISILIVIVII